jgi:hypothetical protein
MRTAYLNAQLVTPFRQASGYLVCDGLRDHPGGTLYLGRDSAALLKRNG